jgi:type I restriction enzyme S subunit
MTADWPEFSIEELKASSRNAIAMGPFGSNIKAENFVEDGIPVIKGGNLTGDFIVEDKFDFLTEEKADELKTSNAFRRDIVITHRGTIGQVGIIPDNSKFVRYVVSQSQLKVTLDQEKVNPYFVYYFLRSPVGQHRLLMNASQVGVPAIAQASTSVKGIMIPCPEKDIQDKVVEIILGLDHKIHKNRQINQTLESISQAIFKSWFVDFEPVKSKIAAIEAGEDAEGVTFAAMRAISGKTDDELDKMEGGQLEDYAKLKTTAELFPAAMQDSELGGVPEGWDVVDLKELSQTISKGTTPSKKQVADAEGAPSISFIKVKDIADDGQINRPGLGLIHKSIHNGALKRSMLEENDLLFSIAGTIGRVSIVENDLHNSNTNQAVAFIRLNGPDHLSLILEHLQSKRIQESAMASVVQGVQANVSLTSVGNFQIVVPKEPILAVWNEVALSLHTEKLGRQKQNRLLSQLRDTLLPKLLSGELEINAVNKAES